MHDSAEYDKLLQSYTELANGVRMIRRAVDRACRAGALPALDHVGVTPLQECEATARVIYAIAAGQKSRTGRGRLAGLRAGEPPA